MRQVNISKAVRLAQEFIAAYKTSVIEGGTKESGHFRRLSMELTRALAEMRKP
jgi:hypothetical protein